VVEGALKRVGWSTIFSEVLNSNFNHAKNIDSLGEVLSSSFLYTYMQMESDVHFFTSTVFSIKDVIRMNAGCK